MRPVTHIAAVIFGFIALVHIYRLVTNIPVTVGNYSVGQEVSWIGLAIAAVMALGLWKEARS